MKLVFNLCKTIMFIEKDFADLSQAWWVDLAGGIG